MSLITDITIVVPYGDHGKMDSINEWCRNHDEERHQEFRALNTGRDDQAGGNKVYTSRVWAMAGNYFPWYDLMDAFTSGKLELPPNWLVYFYPEGTNPVILVSGYGIQDMKIIKGSD